MADNLKTTFRRIDTGDGKAQAARIWDVYRQQWRMFRDYGDIPLRVLASLSGAERDALHARLPFASENRPFE